MKVGLPTLLLALTASSALAGPVRPHTLEVADVQALSSQPPSAILAPVKAMATTGMEPAPVPNPDIDPPHGAGPSGPSLEPAFLSPKLEFQGDGFARASNRDYGIDQRTQPAAGLNLSVPVK
jgi:hypothetical protein